MIRKDVIIIRSGYRVTVSDDALGNRLAFVLLLRSAHDSAREMFEQINAHIVQ